MKIIDLETFPRRSHYEFFKSYAYPYMGMTANMDVTNLYNAAKARGGSPFLAFLWAAANAANSVPELRQRMVGEGIVEYDHCDTAHTVALPDGTFVNCRTDCRRSFDEFLVYGKQCQEEAKGRHGFVQPGDDETELIFVSSTPWVTFTQVIQPTPIPADSNVRIVFGKFFEQNGRKLMPLAIQVNHALVDGLHVGQFYQKFQELADSDLSMAYRRTDDPSVDYGKYPTFAPLKWKLPVAAPEQKPDIVQITPGPEKTDWKNNVLRSDEFSDEFTDESFELDQMKVQPVFGSQYRREQIKSVTFLDSLLEMPEEAWDVSEAENRSVMAWVKPDGELYELYIGAEGGMQAGKNCSEMFAGYTNSDRITFGRALHTEGAEDMFRMFDSCESLTELDLTGFDTSGVKHMSFMFFGCSALVELNLSSFDTSRVEDMHYMFNDCKSLKALDLSGFDTSGVEDMGCMFDGCALLRKLDLSSFDTSNVKDMSYMFNGCGSLRELDLSSFDTSNVTNMVGMFYGCGSLRELDLSSFDTSKVSGIRHMFDNCPAGSKWQHLLH